jgi:hypothetical protein
LLRLYPPRWRRRYGGELTELIAARPFSIGAALDLIAGAIDAWFHLRLVVPPTTDAKGDATMIARIMELKCAGYGPDVTASDKIKSGAVNIGGTLMLALVWLWAQWRFRSNDYLMALSPMAYLLPYLVSLHYTSLKGRSGGTQMIRISGLGLVLTAFLLLVGWIGTRI